VPGKPAALQTEGVPPIPPEVTERLAQYQNTRGAAFEDFGPDGSILVTTRFAETPQLHGVPFPGGRREQITFSAEPVGGGIFVPGTADVLYSQGRGGDENYQIYRLDRRTGRAKLLTDGKSRNGMGPVSRAGDRMVISSNRRNGRDTDLYLLDLKTGATEVLLEARGEFWQATDWSPDGSKLLVLRTVSVNENYPHLLDVASRERRAIPVPGGVKAAHGPLRFASGGREILLASDARSEFRQLARVEIESMAVAWEDQRWDVSEVEVSRDSVAVVTNEDGASRLELRRGGARTAVELPVGIVGGLRFSPDGARLGFTLARPDAPADAYTYELAERKLVRWTWSEAGGLDPAAFVAPRQFSYKSFDGRDIPAYIYLPREARRAPVVISIHGGPESQYRPAFSGVTQYWANELGIAVVAPNVRGSTGYGKTYVALDNGEKREDAVRDIGALLDWIARQPELDASRVAVHGGSYGGYMVLASLVHFGDRIRAGVDLVGIGNWITFLEKTSAYRVDLRRAEYGDERDPAMRATLERISPANHAERIRSALMVVHGRNDPRVPFFEAQQIAARVRAQGRPVWTVTAANEGHGFVRKENRDYLAAATALFFREHLLR
jgi:dipeptidyl aminopeptidase/acylaminoacyl peptidase